MEEIIGNLAPIINIVAYVIMGLVIVATIVARITPSNKDNLIVGSVAGYVIKFIQFLPTLGVNPATKSLEEAYVQLLEEKKTEVVNDESIKPD